MFPSFLYKGEYSVVMYFNATSVPWAGSADSYCRLKYRWLTCSSMQDSGYACLTLVYDTIRNGILHNLFSPMLQTFSYCTNHFVLPRASGLFVCVSL